MSPLVLPLVRIAIKKPPLSTFIEKLGTKPHTTSDAHELATELTTIFLYTSTTNPPGYDLSLFGRLNYKEIAAKLAALQPPNIPIKQ